MISICVLRRKSKLINRRIGDTVWISYGLLYLFLTFKFVSLRSFFRDSDEKSKTSTPIGQKFKVELLPIGVQLHEISWIFGNCSFFRFL